MEIRWALPTDSRMVKPMGCLRTVKPTGWLTDYRMATRTVTRTATRTVTRMGFQKVNPMDLKMVSLRSALPMGNYLDFRLANLMVTSLECLRWDLLKANPMVTHWGWHLGLDLAFLQTVMRLGFQTGYWTV